MKDLFLIVSYAFSIFTSSASCENDNAAPGQVNINANPSGSKMIIRIGTSTFNATLYDNATASAFTSMLTLTLDMVELNGNEKYADLSRSLPTKAGNPGTIQSGNLMLCGSSTLVLFYKSFSTSYTYTMLGRIDDVTGLAAALGPGNVNVTFELD